MMAPWLRADRLDSLLLKAAEVANLKKPDDANLEFLQEWLRGDEEGRSFLRERETDTWSSKHHKDFVTLLGSTSEGVFSQWLNPALVNWYHRLWGGRKEACVIYEIFPISANGF